MGSSNLQGEGLETLNIPPDLSEFERICDCGCMQKFSDRDRRQAELCGVTPK